MKGYGNDKNVFKRDLNGNSDVMSKEPINFGPQWNCHQNLTRSLLVGKHQFC